MKRVMFWLQIIVLIIEVFAVTLLGFEVYGHMNPDHIIAEAIVIGGCLVVNLVCVLYRLYKTRSFNH
jgi:membrane protein YdbS with pleckstrin-like domain